MPVPARIAWAVENLNLRPADRVLEIGCGSGVAAALVAARLTEGSMTAIDRSATAIARAGTRNADHLRSGRLTLLQSTLAEFRSDQRFDKAFANLAREGFAPTTGRKRGLVCVTDRPA